MFSTYKYGICECCGKPYTAADYLRPYAKLIFDKYKRGSSQPKLAKEYGVGPRDIWRILLGFSEYKDTLSNRRERRCFRVYGCSVSELTALVGKINRNGSLCQAYWLQKKGAFERNIEWQLTFPEWLEIWKASGHLEHRGKGAGKYVMSRKLDIGAYSIGNVFIQTHEQNNIDIPLNRIALGKPYRGHTKYGYDSLDIGGKKFYPGRKLSTVRGSISSYQRTHPKIALRAKTLEGGIEVRRIK